MARKARTARAAYGTYSSQREAATRATHDTILRTARNLFSRQGYANIGISAIAAAAGISRPTFYLHFPTKMAVLHELIAEFEEGIVALYEELAAIDQPTLERLAEWVARFLAYCESDRKTVLLVLSTIPTEADIAQSWADLYQRLLTIAGTGHRAFALAASGEDRMVRGRAISLLGQIEALPRMVMAAVPLCDPQSLTQALAENLFHFLKEEGCR